MQHVVKRVPARAKVQVQRARARYGFVDVIVQTVKRFSADDGSPHAAALTYYTFFSIFPLLLFGAAILGYLTQDNETLRRTILDAAVNGLPLIGDALEPGSLKAIEANRRTLALTGLGLALYSGSGGVVALEHALNKINRVAVEPKFLVKRIRSLMWLAVLGAGVLGSVALGVIAGFAPGPLAAIAAVIGGFAINVGVFSAAFKLLPKAEQSWKQVLPGAIFTASVFELLKVFGSTYLSGGEAARNATFGALAGAATLLVASYLISQVILLAAELNAVLCERRQLRTGTDTRTNSRSDG